MTISHCDIAAGPVFGRSNAARRGLSRLEYAGLHLQDVGSFACETLNLARSMASAGALRCFSALNRTFACDRFEIKQFFAILTSRDQLIAPSWGRAGQSSRAHKKRGRQKKWNEEILSLQLRPSWRLLRSLVATTEARYGFHPTQPSKKSRKNIKHWLHKYRCGQVCKPVRTAPPLAGRG